MNRQRSVWCEICQIWRRNGPEHLLFVIAAGLPITSMALSISAASR